MALPSVVLLNDVDIYARGDVEKIIDIEEEKTFSRDKLINNELSIDVKNFDNFYSVGNSDSYFKNIRWRYGSITIKNRNSDLIWDGIIKNIERNHDNGTARIITINSLYQKWNTLVEYTSSAAETPAAAAMNIMDTYGISYDSKTIMTSDAVLDSNGCYVKVNILKQDNVNVMAALEKLAEYACADCYSHLNVVYFKHYTPFTGGVKVNLTEDDFVSRPYITDMESELINQFSIPYDGDLGIPITDTNLIGAISRQDIYYGVHDLPAFDSGGKEAQIYFTTLAGAQYIGETYIRRTHIDLLTNPRPPEKISFSIKGTNDNWIDLETYVRITMDDESWDQKLFEFFVVNRDYSANITRLVAVEIQE